MFFGLFGRAYPPFLLPHNKRQHEYKSGHLFMCVSFQVRVHLGEDAFVVTVPAASFSAALEC